MIDVRTTLYRQALAELGNLKQVHRAMDVPYRTLEDRKTGRRGVTPRAAEELAAFLREHADRLQQLARRLDEVADDDEPPGGRASAGPGR